MKVNYPVAVGLLLIITLTVLIAYFLIKKQFKKTEEMMINTVAVNEANEIIQENEDFTSDVVETVKSDARLMAMHNLAMANAKSKLATRKRQSARRPKKSKKRKMRR